MQRLLSWRPRKCALLALSCVSASSRSFGFSSESSTALCSATHPSSKRLFSSQQGASTTTMTADTDKPCRIAMFPCLNDNYGFLLHSKSTGETAAIDTPDAKAYQASLDQHGWKLTHIFNTHHHWDHTGGNLDLKTDGVKVYGPSSEASKIPGIDEPLKGGDEFVFGDLKCQVIDVGGHTLGHIAYYFPEGKVAFVGDSLFSLGCGRMFEGKPEQFWESLQRLRDLPDDTAVYCAHEYTESNGKFAVSVEPGNPDLQSRLAEVKELRAKDQPTIPTWIGQEKKTNPFLRVDVSPEIRSKCGISEGESDAHAFAKVRRAKDTF